MHNRSLSFKQFWELSEVYTAPLNLFIILLGASVAHQQLNQTANWQLLLFIGTILCFHIAVNIFNHWMDFRNAKDDVYKSQTNIIGRDNLDLSIVKFLFWFWMIASIILGSLLVFSTNWLIGLLGFIGYYIGLFYSYGKYPINSLPIAETLTGLASGFFISVISFYLMTYEISPFTLQDTFMMLAISLPLVISMFSNLLANNTCDLEEDIKNNRHTLVYYLGKEKSVRLLLHLFIFNYLWLLVLVLLNVAPVTVLLLWGFFPKSWHALKRYEELQSKTKTFPIILKVMAVMMVGYPILFFIGGLF